MEKCPEDLTPSHSWEFKIKLFQEEISLLRQRVYRYILSGDKGGFDLRSNTSYGQYSSTTIDQQVVDIIISELEELGLSTQLSFGTTTLFV